MKPVLRPAPTPYLVVLFALFLFAPAVPAAAQGAPDLLSRTYQRQYLPQAAAEAVLWQACPADAGDRCVVLDTDKAGYVRLVAPATVHRRAVQLLAERDTPARAHTVRVDLVSAEAGQGDHLDGVPKGVQQALDGLRPELGRVAFTHLDSGIVRTRGDGGILLLAGGQRFYTNLHLSRAGDPSGDRLKVDLSIRTAQEAPLPKSDDPPLEATLLNAALDLSVGQPTVAGVTRLSAKRNLVVLLTATP